MSDALTLLGVGGAHIDRVGHWHEPGANGVSHPGTMSERVGGCMINTLRVARHLGTAPVGLISARGGDGAGAMVGDALQKDDIADHCAIFMDRATAQYVAIMDGAGDVRAALADMDIYRTGLARHLRRAEPCALIAAATTVMVDANLPPDAIGHVARQARGRLIALAVSPAKAPGLRDHGAAIDLICMNRRELAALTERPVDTPISDLLAHLQSIGFDRAVVSDGAAPVMVMNGLDIEPVPSLAVDTVRDVTGAGDALAGTIAALWPAMELRDAVALGIAAAALTVGVEGPVHGELTRVKLQALAEKTL